MEKRYISVDFLRGFTVAGMILVNNPGSWDFVYSPLLHAPWNGCTFADLIFPFFLFIMGISVNFALQNKKNSFGKDRQKIIIKLIKRSAVLFLIGLFLNAFPYFELSSLRIPGVLQRIAIVFLACSVIYLYFGVRAQVTIFSVLLIGYYLLLTFVPVPDFGAANLEPATNLAAWVDRLLLDGHLWKFSKTWDPEGVLSTFPSIATGLSGVLAGSWLLSDRKPKDKIIYMFISGFTLMVAGAIWGMFFPINKSLWTSSYVLFTTGVAMNGLALSVWFMDVKKYEKYATPFIAFGSNAIIAYVGSELLSRIFYEVSFTWAGQQVTFKHWLYLLSQSLFESPYNASLLLSIGFVLLLLLPLYYMYRNRIIIKV